MYHSISGLKAALDRLQDLFPLVGEVLVELLLDDVEVVPVPEPHGAHGEVLDHDAQDGGEHDLGQDEGEAEPGVPCKK